MKQVERMDQDTESFDDGKEDDLAELGGLDNLDSPHESSSPILPQVLQGVFFILLALAAGWLGGRWASQPITQEPAAVTSAAESEPTMSAPPDVAPLAPPKKDTQQQAYLGIRGKGARLADVHGLALADPEIKTAFASLASRVQTPQERKLFDHLRALYVGDLILADPEIKTAFASLASRVQTPQERKLFDHLRALYDRLHLVGVQITEVLSGSPAAQAGLRAITASPVPSHLRELSPVTGHIIIGANGHLVRSEKDLAAQLLYSTPDAPMELLVSSADGESYEVVVVTLAEAPPPDADAPKTMAAKEKKEVSQSLDAQQAEKPMP